MRYQVICIPAILYLAFGSVKLLVEFKVKRFEIFYSSIKILVRTQTEVKRLMPQY